MNLFWNNLKISFPSLASCHYSRQAGHPQDSLGWLIALHTQRGANQLFFKHVFICQHFCFCQKLKNGNSFLFKKTGPK